VPQPMPDAAPLGGVGPRRGRADHRLDRAIGLHRHPCLLVGAVPDGVGRAWAYLRRVIRPTLRRWPCAVSDGTAYRFGDNFLRYDFRRLAIGAFIPLVFGRETELWPQGGQV
jgi:hypothetical protein